MMYMYFFAKKIEQFVQLELLILVVRPFLEHVSGYLLRLPDIHVDF